MRIIFLPLTDWSAYTQQARTQTMGGRNSKAIYMFLSFVGYFKALSVSSLYNVRCKDDRDMTFGNDLEGSRRFLFEVL
jgi:hypothetical protein